MAGKPACPRIVVRNGARVIRPVVATVILPLFSKTLYDQAARRSPK
ncbi:MAG: hypothetical protein JXA20_06870 [Spirochaetes bacterium]|nr:hypothetical protein [Spirochaetota bacterium]